MVDFRNFIGRGTGAGSPLSIWAQVLLPYLNVGHGEFIDLGAQQAAFKGKIDTVFYKGDFTLALKLLEDGKAEISLNGSRASVATYTVKGSKLSIDAKFGAHAQVIVFEPGGKNHVETYLSVSGSKSINVHLAPGEKPKVS